jgi:hypothetical protein
MASIRSMTERKAVVQVKLTAVQYEHVARAARSGHTASSSVRALMRGALDEAEASEQRHAR